MNPAQQPDHRLLWFTDRIGKRVYRIASSCTCVICAKVFREGLTIEDEQHARYLLEWDRHGLTYFDTIQERDLYQQDLTTS